MPWRIQPLRAAVRRDHRRRFRKQIKRLPERGGKLPTLPRRVRKHEIQEPPLLMCILLGEQPRRALSQVEQARPLFEVILIRRLMQADLAQAGILLRAHVVRELLEKVTVDL